MLAIQGYCHAFYVEAVVLRVPENIAKQLSSIVLSMMDVIIAILSIPFPAHEVDSFFPGLVLKLKNSPDLWNQRSQVDNDGNETRVLIICLARLEVL